jgi:hypothetical protein
MSVAYYIVVNGDAAGFVNSLDGKALAHNSEEINAAAESLGLKSLDDYFSISREKARSEIASLLGIEDENALPPESEAALKKMPPEAWYGAFEGLNYAMKIAAYIEKNPNSVSDHEEVLQDLHDWMETMKSLQKSGMKWHLAVDY